MPTARVRDLELYYETLGRGPRLLYISGTGGDLRQKPSVFDGPLPRHFSLLAYDQRGLGRSAKPDMGYTMADYADDAAALLDSLGWERCLVMGVSFGGMVAQELALRHPDRIERLVLACTSSGGRGGASFPLQELQTLEPEERARRQLELADTRRTREWQDAHPELMQTILAQLTAPRPNAAEPAAETGAQRQIEARAHHDTYERLATLRVPTFVCGGRYDAIAAPSNLEALADRIPDAKLQLYDGGHLFLVQDATAFQDAIRFLNPTEA